MTSSPRTSTAAPKGGSAKRRSRRGRKDRWVSDVELWAVILIVAFGILPIALIGTIGILQGTSPSSDDGGILGAGPGYPLFQPPFWILWVPAIMMFGLSVVTFRMPLQRFFVGPRLEMSTVSVVGFGTTFTASVAYGGMHVSVMWASLLYLAAIVLFGLRALLGAFGWLPESWRVDPPTPSRKKSTPR